MARAARSNNGGKDKSVMGYFRDLFTNNRKWLKTRSNDAVVQRWLADNPGASEIPQKAKSALANVKSVLRKKLRIGKRQRRDAAMAAGGAAAANVSPKPKYKGLELLEVEIDDCLTLARNQDRDGELSEVIRSLRHARNQVVWKAGQTK